MSPELIVSYLNEGYEDNELTIKDIIRNLSNQGVQTKLENCQLFAFDETTRVEAGKVIDCSEWVNTTGWKGFDVLAFLGY